MSRGQTATVGHPSVYLCMISRATFCVHERSTVHVFLAYDGNNWPLSINYIIFRTFDFLSIYHRMSELGFRIWRLIDFTLMGTRLTNKI